MGGRPISQEWCWWGLVRNANHASAWLASKATKREVLIEVLTTNREVLIGSGEPEFPSETDDRGAAPSSDIEDSVEDAAGS